MYQSFSTNGERDYQNNLDNFQNLVRDEYYVTPNLDAELGFAWSSYFDNEKWHIAIAASYDFHYFWNQNLLRKNLARMNEKVNNNNSFGPIFDLMMHGLTVTARLDF